ncbi:MAG TPA: sporulation membrane protein YtaF, partial [Syntrophomonadaceae bacterium]|nr:sporulation membrane protein YtaF [Syntrophomonadaceae bacterium]
PMLSLAVIALASGLAVIISMICGKGLATLVPKAWAANIGSVILIIIGVYFILGAFKKGIKDIEHDEEKPLLSFNIRPLGIIIQILKESTSADFDSSGVISTKEAFFLGLVLALDALGAGIGVAMSGFSILSTALAVGMLKFILVNMGIFLGGIMSNSRLKTVSALIPGVILITIGLLGYI